MPINGVISTIIVSLVIFTSQETRAQFIFTGDKVTNTRKAKEFVRLSEKLPVAQLKKRFVGYKIEATASEDCDICATVSGRDGSIAVNYDSNGIVVVGINGRDKKATDAL